MGIQEKYAYEKDMKVQLEPKDILHDLLELLGLPRDLKVRSLKVQMDVYEPIVVDLSVIAQKEKGESDSVDVKCWHEQAMNGDSDDH